MGCPACATPPRLSNRTNKQTVPSITVAQSARWHDQVICRYRFLTCDIGAYRKLTRGKGWPEQVDSSEMGVYEICPHIHIGTLCARTLISMMA